MINRMRVWIGVIGLVLVVIASCELEEKIQRTVTITNYIETSLNVTNNQNIIDIGIYTNVDIITNYVYVTNAGYVLQGNIYITNTYNEARVQPTFLISGTMDGDLTDYIPDGINAMSVEVTNSGFVTNVLVQTVGGVKTWRAVVFAQTNHSYIFTKVRAQLTGVGDYFMAMNFRISNIPAYELNGNFAGTVTNAASVNLTGTAWVAEPDSINAVYLTHVNGAYTNVRSLSLSGEQTGWTNTVNAKDFSWNVALSNGDNIFFGKVIGDNGLTNSISSFTVTKAMIGVDGLKDDNWLTAPVVGSSSNAGYNGYQLGELRITNDDYNLYFWVDAQNVPDLGVGDYNGPRISIAIDTNSATGVTNDAWGGTFVLNPANLLLPDYQLQFRIQTGGGQALYCATNTNGVDYWKNIANNWSGNMRGIKMVVQRTNGFEIGVPLSLLNIGSGSVIHAMVILSGQDGDNANKQAWDVIPENALNETVSNENQFDVSERAYCAPYVLN